MSPRLFLACLLLCAATIGLAQKQSPPEGGKPMDIVLPERFTLQMENGLKATLIEYGTIPKVFITVAVRVGNINEGESEVWLGDVVGDMMKEGTARRSAEEIANAAARMGGTLSISVGSDYTSVGGSALSESGPEFVALLAEVTRNPTFPESELARIKADKVRDLLIQRADPRSLALERFRSLLYPGHPYGRVFPTEEMVKGYTLEQVKTFHAENFGAARTHVYVAGRFDARVMEKAIRDAFHGWPRGPQALVNVPKPASRRRISIVDRPGAVQSTITMGVPVMDPSNPEYRAFSLMNVLLGGSFSSRITTNIREQKGYTYSPRSTISSRYRDADWTQLADVSSSVTGASLREIFAEIDRLQAEPPTAAELKGFQNFLAGQFVIQTSSPSGIMALVMFMDLHGLPESYLRDAVKNIHAVTPVQIQNLAQSMVRDEEMTIVIVGDRKQIERQVAPFGEVMK